MGKYAEDAEFDGQLARWVARREAYYRANREALEADRREWDSWLAGHPRHVSDRPRGVEVRAEAPSPPSAAKARSRAIRGFLAEHPGQFHPAKGIAEFVGCTTAQARRSLGWLKRQGIVESSGAGWRFKSAQHLDLG